MSAFTDPPTLKQRCDYNNDIFLNKVTAKEHTCTLDTRLTNHSSSGYCSYPMPHTHSSSSTIRLALHVSETMMVGRQQFPSQACSHYREWMNTFWVECYHMDLWCSSSFCSSLVRLMNTVINKHIIRLPESQVMFPKT